MNARDHIRAAARLLDDDSIRYGRIISHALLAIACTLADMADMDADTRTQPAIKPPMPAPNYQLYHPGDTERIPHMIRIDQIEWHHGITMRWAEVDGYKIVQGTLGGANEDGEYDNGLNISKLSDPNQLEYFFTLEGALAAIQQANDEGR